MYRVPEAALPHLLLCEAQASRMVSGETAMCNGGLAASVCGASAWLGYPSHLGGFTFSYSAFPPLPFWESLVKPFAT